MKKYIITTLLICSHFLSFAQDAKQLHETAKAFMRQADYANAILVLNRAVLLEPKNITIQKDLALSYYFQRDNVKAQEIAKSLVENDAADDQVFQLAGLIYRQAGMLKDAEKVYKKGLKEFPKSGPLYNDLGELQWQQQDYEAIKQWEKGIETDPSFSKNYYNAAKYYYLSTDKLWSLIYGEIFLNMEPASSNAPEIKELLLNGYKKLFIDASLQPDSKEKSEFVRLYFKTMNEQSTIASTGINANTLSMIRTRFILSWFNSKQVPSFRLFKYQQELLKEGLFEAYNQWLFGSAQNLSNFQHWVNTHTETYNAFVQLQKNKLFKMPPGEYYK